MAYEAIFTCGIMDFQNVYILVYSPVLYREIFAEPYPEFPKKQLLNIDFF